jgi:site-specific recombinase XerC
MPSISDPTGPSAARRKKVRYVQALFPSGLRSRLLTLPAESTRERWRSKCDDIRRKYGVAIVETLSARHIKQDLSKFEGHAANNRLKVWRSLCAYWDEMGMIEVNVARQIATRRTPKTDGHMPWTREDFAAFRSHWPIGTKERLAFELMYRTCAAIGDMTRLSRGMVADGWQT